jgi:predicted Zn-ribbon and HTH transcriptional regulator
MADEYENVSETRRQYILRLLEETGSALDLKSLFKVLEYGHKKHLLDDIERIAGALRREDRELLVQPSSCIACGFIFSPRDKRLQIPSKCPKCNAERITWPSIKLRE